MSERERRFVRNGGTRRLGGSRGHGGWGGGGRWRRAASPPQRGAGERSVAGRGALVVGGVRWGDQISEGRGAKHEGMNEILHTARAVERNVTSFPCCLLGSAPRAMVLYVPEPWPAGTSESALLHGSPVPDFHGSYAQNV